LLRFARIGSGIAHSLQRCHGLNGALELPADGSCLGGSGFVDHHDPVVEGRPELPVAFAAQTHVGTDIIALFELGPPARKGGLILGHAPAHHGHQPAAGLQKLQGLFDVPGPGENLLLVAHPARGLAEGRVHDHDGRFYLAVQYLAELLGVLLVNLIETQLPE